LAARSEQIVLLSSFGAVIKVTMPCENPRSKESPAIRETALSQRPEGQRGALKNLAFGFLGQRECAESIQRFLDLARTRTRPVAAEHGFVRDLRQTRKVLEQLPRRNAADVQVNIRMATHQEKGGVHPEWAPAMGEHNLELRKINRHIVDVNRVSILVARAGEN